MTEDQAHYKKVIDDVQALFDAKRKRETKVRSTEEALSTERALKLALEALDWINRVNAMEYEYQQKARESLNAIYDALAEQPAQHQEPVAWKTDDVELYVREDKFGFYNIPLYTSPPASKPWVGLTEQERNYLEDYCEMIIGKAAFEAIETKLKEKNT